MTLADFRAQVDANLFGVVNVTKAALPLLREQGGGHIIGVSSIGGRLATAGLSAYQAAKWAVGGFSEVLAKEVGPLGIKVTVLEPGGMRTDWAGSSMRVPPVSEPYQPTVGAMARLHHDLGSANALGDPAKVARVVLEVASMAEPPLRLILGSEAYAYAMAAARARAEADAAWHDLTVSTDRDDATAADRDPLGAMTSDPGHLTRWPSEGKRGPAWAPRPGGARQPWGGEGLPDSSQFTYDPICPVRNERHGSATNERAARARPSLKSVTPALPARCCDP